ncbi:VOC family protein [Salinisphaera aquimarina]|uniref:VOC family protein n=1 Tax=Salinisphaera aquimarina TaxID=2094031 RepID=A0ABV7EUK6_9GAMM
MRNRHGTPIWYELLTRDADAAQTFYSAVIGWSVSKPAGGLERDYRIISTMDSAVGGLLRSPDDAGMAPQWLFYIGVDDVDAAAAKLNSLGGSVHVEPTDIPDVGRFAFVADPQGAPFYLMRGASDEQSRSFAPTVAGHCAWNELAAANQDTALEFYQTMFGWTKGDVMPMGPMGDYSFIHHGDTMLGAMMNRPQDSTPPMWRYYFRVDDIDAINAAIAANGGTLLHGPTEVPGGDWVIQARDPQGAMIGFVGSRGA